jgi:signal transduction histidine kinase
MKGFALLGVAVAAGALGLLAAPVYILRVWLGVVFLPGLEYFRPLANLARRLAGEWCGVPVEVPYRPKPAPPVAEADGRYRLGTVLTPLRALVVFGDRVKWVGDDPATRRDVVWMLLHPFVGGALSLAYLIAGRTSAGPALLRAQGRWIALLLRPASARRVARAATRRAWLAEHAMAVVRCLALVGLSLLALGLALVRLVGIMLCYGLGLLFVLPPVIEHTRWLPVMRRRLIREWSGIEAADPYKPRPGRPPRRPDGMYRVDNSLYKTEHWAFFMLRWRWLVQDWATWRDLAWMLSSPGVTGVLGVVPVVLIGYGVGGLALPGVLTAVAGGPVFGPWYGAIAGASWLAIPVGVAMAVVGFLIAPLMLRIEAPWAAYLLSPTRAAELTQRVARLTQTRADAIDAQTAEIQRIERDLHDGAQARLVAVGLTLGAAEELVESDPVAAKRLLAQARESSVTALGELRALVRGILPPVLTERGLGDAVRAVALDSPLPVEVDIDLPGRPAAPVESAAYFALCEALANAARHSGAERVWISIRYDAGVLRMVVTDDGRGGADPTRGTGLRGVDRRLGTFDGTLAVESPVGGPTEVTMEVPCALSSPRTSTSSGTG